MLPTILTLMPDSAEAFGDPQFGPNVERNFGENRTKAKSPACKNTDATTERSNRSCSYVIVFLASAVESRCLCSRCPRVLNDPAPLRKFEREPSDRPAGTRSGESDREALL